ncbi:MAG: hypothetical protein HKN32_00510 [Flavobacteriales bacterium]|nr:hypothetical protein [Flavobacteriales bacterium]
MTEEDELKQEVEKDLIMIIGKHGYIVENVQRILKGKGYDTVTMLEEYEELQRRMLAYDYKLLLIVGSVEPHMSEDLVQASKKNKPEIPILFHHGGPATIPTEVNAALNP